MPQYQSAHENMLTHQLRCNGVLDDHLLDIIRATDRRQFVPEKFTEAAYADSSLLLDHGQIMLPPEEQARIIQALNVKPTDNILELGTGLGYMTALLAKLGHTVCSIELFLDFTEQAKRNLSAAGVENVQLLTDDANKIWDNKAPYDIICCTAAMALYPETYKKALNVGGRLFCFIGSAPSMQATLITRTADTTWSETVLFDSEVPAMINAPAAETFTF
jgi:protein-L-isoaspartate(D-aspartate) O-methyltransferase